MKDYKNNIYQAIKTQSDKYGKYHKCLFHLHTYASHDYRILEKCMGKDGQEQKKLAYEDLLAMCCESELFSRIVIENNIKTILENNNEYYQDGYELLVYLLIGWELIKNSYEMVLVTDHNTISGYDKLNHAIGIIYEWKKGFIKKAGYKYPILILGIEVSCADKNHVVGIFDDAEKTRTKLRSDIELFIKNNIMGDNTGSYLTSMDIISKINEINGIAYIAHVNSSPMVSPKKEFLSGAYSKKLFNMQNLKTVGLHSIDQKDKVNDWISNHTAREFSYVIDCDSHAIDTIKNGFFWIKGNKCDFKMIKEAIQDSDIAIRYMKPDYPTAFIEGIWVVNHGQAFLLNKRDENIFSCRMSPSLNCFIGGRGTGKSTVLNIIEAVLGQNFINESVFNAIAEYDELWLLYYYKNKEYLVNFMPLVKEYQSDTAYMDLKEKIRGKYKVFWNNEFSKNIRDLKEFLLKDCIHIYPIDCDIVSDKEISKSMLNKFFDRAYSVNELVKTASGDTINTYISDTMGMNEKFKIRRRNIYDIETLFNFINNVNDLLKNRKKKVLAEIDMFNNDVTIKGKIRITYEQKQPKNFIEFDKILETYQMIGENKYIWETNLSLDGLVACLYKACNNIGVIEFVKKILRLELNTLDFDFTEFSDTYTSKMAEQNFKRIEDIDQKNCLFEINKFIVDKKIDYLIDVFKFGYLEQAETFSLEFNVMNREGETEKTNYRDIKKLSLGQKVVAMLSFVIGYSTYINDFRPLIIDQPEDNLDNQYIYKNLVDDLRKIKGTRQVIIATHSATIVTNAKAEQVIVMESDGEHGWIKDSGYPTRNEIKRNILNYMEGGVESFKHKMLVYNEVLE